jgi:hypothetical protein
MIGKGLRETSEFLQGSYPTHAHSLPSYETVMTSQEHLVPYPKEITMKSNSRFMKIAVATGLIVVTGAAALGITSFASAQVADQPSAVVVTTDDTATETTTPSTDATTPSTDGAMKHEGKHMGGHKGGPGKFNSEGLASVLKLTAEEFKAELQSGKSLAAIAEAQKVDIADVKAQLVKDFTARLDDMVNMVPPSGRGMGGHKGAGMGQHRSN